MRWNHSVKKKNKVQAKKLMSRRLVMLLKAHIFNINEFGEEKAITPREAKVVAGIFWRTPPALDPEFIG